MAPVLIMGPGSSGSTYAERMHVQRSAAGPGESGPAFRSWLMLVLLAAAAVAAAAAVVGGTDAWGWVVLQPALGQSHIYLALSVVCATAALWIRNRSVPLLLLGGAAAVAVVVWGVLDVMLGATAQVVQRLPAPGPARYTAFVRSGAAMADPFWVIEIRSGKGLSARRWPAACFDGDDPDRGFEAARWLDASTLRLTSADGATFMVHVTAAGRPRQHEVGTC